MAVANGKALSFKFASSRLGADSAASLEILPGADDGVKAAVLANQPLPGDLLVLSKGTLGTKGGKKVVLRKGTGSVSFEGEGNASFQLLLASDLGKVEDALSLDGEDPVGLDLPARDPGHRFALLQAGYAVRLTGNGAVALGGSPGSVRFTGSGERNAVFGLVRRIQTGTGAADIVRTVVGGWQLPRHVAKATDMDPETWLVTEVDGSLSLELGATAGYDLDWVRDFQVGGLSGDLGLRLQLGLEAQLGYKASGRYLLVVARESAAPVLRVRLFKARVRGWTFALNAGASAKLTTSGLPATADELVAAAFGVQGRQVVSDLRRLEGWTGAGPLSDRLASLGAQEVKDRVLALVGDGGGTFEQSRQKLLDLLSRWDALPQKASSKVWELLAKQVPAARIRGWAQKLAGVPDAAGLRSLVESHLAHAAFFQEPEGQLLEALALDSLFHTLGDLSALNAVRARAAEIADFLDPTTTLPVLQRLHGFVGQSLGLEQLRQNLDQAGFDKLDPWLKARLADLLGRPPLLADLDAIRKSISLLLQKRQEWYAAGRRALEQSFEMEMAATYARTATSEALLDVEFDFAQDDGNLGARLEKALDGNMADLFVASRPGVRLRVGSLTHGVSRHTHLGLSLPFFEGSLDALNQSLAKATATEVDGTRVLVYEMNALDATQEARSWRGRLQRTSRLSLAMMVGDGAVRRHGAVSGSVGYAMRISRKGMQPGELEAILEPWVSAYLGTQFAGPGTGSLAQWVRDLDFTVDAAEFNGANLLGDVHVSLDVLLDEGILRAWQAVPPATDTAFLQVTCRNASAAVQLALREFIPALYFRNLDRYVSDAATKVLLVYAASHPSVAKDFHFDWPDREERQKRVAQAQAALVDRYAAIRLQLEAAKREKQTKWYAASEVPDAQAAAAGPMGDAILASLYGCEAGVVAATVKAIDSLARFRAGQGDPETAMAALQSFGSSLTQAVNEKFVSLYTRGTLRALGPALLLRLASTLDPSILVGQRALISVRVMKKGAPLPEDGLETDVAIPASSVLVEQRLLGGA